MGRYPLEPQERRKRARKREKRDSEKRNMRRRTRYKYPIKNQKCAKCGREAEVRHHLKYDEDSIVFLCKNCHKLEHRKWN